MAEVGEEKTTEAVSERDDELAESLALLFSDVSVMIKGELQGTNNQLMLLEKLNRRVTDEYKGFGDAASSLQAFVEQLSEKSRGFDEYARRIDAIDRQVTGFEAVVSMLDKHVCLLEQKVRAAYRRSPS